MKTRLINIGRIYREHGVKGFCKVALLPGRGGGAISAGTLCRLKRDDGEVLETRVAETAVMGRFTLVRWQAFTVPEQLVPWRQAEIWMRASARKRAKGEIFDDEWIGYTLLDTQGVAVGTVMAIVYNPLKQFVLDRGRAGRLLVPFVEEWFLKMDRRRRRLQLAVPEGLIGL